MLKQRILSALVFVPGLLIIILLTPNFVFSLLVLAISAVGAYEYYSMSVKSGDYINIRKWGGIAASTLIAGLIIFLEFSPVSFSLIVLIILIALSYFLFLPREIPASFEYMVFGVYGLIYPTLLIPFLALINNLPHGTKWLIMLFAVVWLGDSGAYIAGKNFGQKKLYPKISPGKTFEGAIGGLAASIITAMILKFVLFYETLPLGNAILLGLVAGVLGQIGDLAESFVKRRFEVKDSSNLIPGHGGILDRIDAVIFAAPAIYLYAKYLFE